MQENYKISILTAGELTSDNLEDLNALQEKLHSAGYKELTVEEQKKYLHNSNLKVVVARANVGILKGLIVGMGTVSLLPRFRSLECEIHDVVVSDDHEGQGLGTAITKNLISTAFGDFKADKITLTSRDGREGAIHIYEKLGFKRKPQKTNTFVLGC